MQILDFFDFLTNSVMMPIAAIATCLLVSRVVGVQRIEEEVTRAAARSAGKDIYSDDEIPLSDLCSDYFNQFHSKCFRMDSDVVDRKGAVPSDLEETLFL